MSRLSTLAIVLIVLGVLVVLFFIGGCSACAPGAPPGRHLRRACAAADAALEQARALDRGWHRETMEEAARARRSPRRRGDWAYDDLHLVLVDDRPGVEEDRAHFVAVGPDGECRVVILAREGDSWVAERVE